MLLRCGYSLCCFRAVVSTNYMRSSELTVHQQLAVLTKNAAKLVVFSSLHLLRQDSLKQDVDANAWKVFRVPSIL